MQFGRTPKLFVLAAALLIGPAPGATKDPQTAAPKATARSACNQISDEAKCKAEATC
jgi:hypothetical protein